MEIRRIEPELISPTAAGEQSARIDKDRPSGGQPRERRRKTPPGVQDAPLPPEGEQDERPVGTPVYQPDGQLQEESPVAERRRVDYTA